MNKIKVLILAAIFLICSSASALDLLTIQGNQEQGTLIVDAFCSVYDYSATIKLPDGSEEPNPETRKDFTNRMILTYLTNVVKQYRVNEAEAIRIQKIQEAETATTGILVN